MRKIYNQEGQNIKVLKIIGAGYELPERVVSTEELETMMNFEKVCQSY